MVGVGERDEALGMFGRRKQLARVVDPDGGIDRGVEDQQSFAQILDALQQALLGDVVEKLAADPESSSADLDLAMAPLVDEFDPVPEQSDDVARIGRRGERDDGAGLRHHRGGSQYGSAAEAVTDQQGGRTPRCSQTVRRSDEIGDIGGKMRIGEIAFAGPQPGEIESQHSDPARRERLGNTFGRQAFLAASEAMSKQCVSNRLL